MSLPKYRDRLLSAAVRLLEANGVKGDFTGDLDFLETVDAVLEECEDQTTDELAAAWNNKGA